jgi:hypothetical protein
MDIKDCPIFFLKTFQKLLNSTFFPSFSPHFPLIFFRFSSFRAILLHLRQIFLRFLAFTGSKTIKLAPFAKKLALFVKIFFITPLFIFKNKDLRQILKSKQTTYINFLFRISQLGFSIFAYIHIDNNLYFRKIGVFKLA